MACLRFGGCRLDAPAPSGVREFFVPGFVVGVAILAGGCGGVDPGLGGPYEGASSAEAAMPVTDGGGSGSGGTHGSTSGSSGSSAGTGSGPSGGGSGGSSSGSSGGSSGGGSGSGSGASTGSGSGASSGGSTAPTFTEIWTDYFASGTTGDCAGCHHHSSNMGSASEAYSYLKEEGYIDGTSSELVTSSSCLTWYGGDMPPGGSSSDAQAVSALNAWVAAGAQDN